MKKIPTNKMNITVIIPAAGQGKRFGNKLPKQFLNLNGIPVIIRTLMIFDDIEEIQNVIIAVDSSYKKLLQDFILQFGIQKKVTFVRGGKERQDSIFNAIGLKAVQNSDLIIVHDAVRPLASQELFKRVIRFTNKFDAVIPGIMPNDTIKCIDSKGFVHSTFLRNNLRKIQTPQGFKTDVFLDMYRKMKSEKISVTDDAALAENAGYKVKIIEGEEQNIKITTAVDMLLASSVLKNNEINKQE